MWPQWILRPAKFFGSSLRAADRGIGRDDVVLGGFGPTGTDLRVWSAEYVLAASVLVWGRRSWQSANPPRIVALRNCVHHSPPLQASISARSETPSGHPTKSRRHDSQGDVESCVCAAARNRTAYQGSNSSGIRRGEWTGTQHSGDQFLPR